MKENNYKILWKFNQIPVFYKKDLILIFYLLYTFNMGEIFVPKTLGDHPGSFYKSDMSIEEIEKFNTRTANEEAGKFLGIHDVEKKSDLSLGCHTVWKFILMLIWSWSFMIIYGTQFAYFHNNYENFANFVNKIGENTPGMLRGLVRFGLMFYYVYKRIKASKDSLFNRVVRKIVNITLFLGLFVIGLLRNGELKPFYYNIKYEFFQNTTEFSYTTGDLEYSGLLVKYYNGFDSSKNLILEYANIKINNLTGLDIVKAQLDENIKKLKNIKFEYPKIWTRGSYEIISKLSERKHILLEYYDGLYYEDGLFTGEVPELSGRKLRDYIQSFENRYNEKL